MLDEIVHQKADQGIYLSLFHLIHFSHSVFSRFFAV